MPACEVCHKPTKRRENVFDMMVCSNCVCEVVFLKKMMDDADKN